MPKLSTLPRENGKVRYRGRLWEIDNPVPSDRPGKKQMVLAKKGDEVKLVHFGDSSMKDYRQHESKSRRANYLARSGGIRNKDGQLTKDDPFSPNYWSRKVLWASRKDSMGDRTALLERIDSVLGRMDARAGMTLCTPGKTIPCGKVCRTPPNCKKGGKGRAALTTEAIKEYAAAKRAQRNATKEPAIAPPPKRSTKKAAAAAPKGVAKTAPRDSDVLIKLVDVSAIAPPKKLAQDKATKKLASDLVVSGGAMSAPVIVVRDGVDSFRVANDPENNKLASAAFMAKSLNPRAAGMANAYIAESDDEARDMLSQRKGFKAKDAIAVPGGNIKLVDVSAISGSSGTPSASMAESRNRVGNTAPVVLREIAPNQYEVESGHDAYASMQLAKQQNPRRAEMFSAYVVPSTTTLSSATRRRRTIAQPDISMEDLNNSEAMLKKSLGNVTGMSGDRLETEWNRIKLESGVSDVHYEELSSATDKWRSRKKRKDSIVERIDSLLERFDAKGQGVPCGNGWIPRSKKCGKDKARSTPVEARKRGAEKTREYNKLRGEVKASAGMKPRVKPDLEEPARELEDLFIQSERIGNKYQSKEERDRFQKQLNAEVAGVSDIIDRQFKDEAIEVVDFSQRRRAQGAIAADQQRKALPVHTGMKIPGKAGEIFANADKRRKVESVTAEPVTEPKSKLSGARRRAQNALDQIKANQRADLKLTGAMAGTAAAAVQKLAEVRGEELEPIALTSSSPAPMKKPRGSTKQRVAALLDQLKENEVKGNKNAAGFLAVAQMASNELAKEAEQMAQDEASLPPTKGRKRKKTLAQQIDEAPQRALPRAKTVKGVSIE